MGVLPESVLLKKQGLLLWKGVSVIRHRMQSCLVTSDIEHSLVWSHHTCVVRIVPFSRTPFLSRIRLFGELLFADLQAYQRFLAENVFHKDIMMILLSLCKLSMKEIPTAAVADQRYIKSKKIRKGGGR